MKWISRHNIMYLGTYYLAWWGYSVDHVTSVTLSHANNKSQSLGTSSRHNLHTQRNWNITRRLGTSQNSFSCCYNFNITNMQHVKQNSFVWCSILPASKCPGVYTVTIFISVLWTSKSTMSGLDLNRDHGRQGLCCLWSWPWCPLQKILIDLKIFQWKCPCKLITTLPSQRWNSRLAKSKKDCQGCSCKSCRRFHKEFYLELGWVTLPNLRLILRSACYSAGMGLVLSPKINLKLHVGRVLWNRQLVSDNN